MHPVTRTLPIISLFLALVPWPVQAGISESQLQRIDELGTLNGVALQCNQVELVQQMKLAIIYHVPKIAAMGDRFDDATNNSFLDFINSQSDCPAEPVLKLQVEQGVERLKEAFPKHQ